MSETPLGEKPAHLGGRTPRPLPTPPEDCCRQRLMWAFIIGLYAWLTVVHLQFRAHVLNETEKVMERLASLEHEISPGILPQARTEIVHLRMDLASLSHRLDLVELDNAKLSAAVERIKPLFVPRMVPAR